MVSLPRRIERSQGALPLLLRLLLLLLLLLLVPTFGQAFGSATTTTTTLTSTSPYHVDAAYHYDRYLVEAQDQACEELGDCNGCFRKPGCGFCGGSGQCMSQARAGTCAKGWSDAGICYTTCPADAAPFHEAAGVIQLGAQAPQPVRYIPGETCTYTIWPLPESGTTGGSGPAGGNRRALMIRLQFEYLDLGPGDTLNIFSNGLDGPKILSIAGNGQGVVNRIITSRSSSVVLRLNAEGLGGGTGFRVYWRVIESSPLDIYLISAIIVTSILTCILCSCCCNNCVAMIAGHHPGRGIGRFGLSLEVGAPAAGAAGHGVARALSAQEKARLPIAPYDPGPAAGGEEGGQEGGREGGLEAGASSIYQYDFRECCICLSEFERTDLVRKLPCGHLFHSECVDSWFSVNSVCPLCKADVRGKLNEYSLPEGMEGGSGGGRGPRALMHFIRQRLLVHVHRHPPPTAAAAAAPAPAADPAAPPAAPAPATTVPAVGTGGGMEGEREEGREEGVGGGGWLGRWWGYGRDTVPHAPTAGGGGGGGGGGEGGRGEGEEEEEQVVICQLPPERRGGGRGGGGDVESGEREGETKEGEEWRGGGVLTLAQ